MRWSKDALARKIEESRDDLQARADAAIRNEQITRDRVTAVEAVLSRPFVGRLKWFFLGR